MNVFAAIALVIGAAFLSALLGGVFVWFLWDWAMPPVFGLPTITYWQAFALAMLCEILFKSHRASSKE